MIRSRSGFRALPITLAFIFNIVAPVFSAAAPAAPLGPLAQAPQTSAALANPDHVAFTLEGCRNPSVALPNVNGFVCADGDYTTGNLGKTWNELDLVPHRLTTSAGASAPASQTYTMGIAADSMDAGHPGYDVITAPVLNAAKSDASCAISVGGQQTISPGVGGTDESIGRLLTITQDQNTVCVFDWAERLALGSHLFPGSSLHTNTTDFNFSTAGIGAKDVSIPVKEILPQELSKTMSATQGQAYSWSITKQANPTSLAFLNTCADTQGALSAQVAITVTWTRSGPSASGDTTVTTEITATNPAHRIITVSVVDKIYSGNDQSTLIDTASSGAIDVAAASSTVILTHTFLYNGNATSFNDVATATYTDKVTGIPVPGNTQATASADTVAGNGPIQFASATITDTESITGTGLSFSVATPTPSIGSFSGYTAGASTTGPVSWSAGVSGSGSVTFTKTVSVSAPMITSGSLDDTATVTSEEHQFDQKNLRVPITADATVSLTISKSIPLDSLSGNQTASFIFDITGPNDYSAQRTLSFAAGDTSKSVTIDNLAPGTYVVHEEPLAGWASQSNQSVDLSLPTCSGTAAFTNAPQPDVTVEKSTSTAVVSAGDPVAYQIVVTAGGVGASHDVTLHDALPALASGSWSAAIVSPDGNDSCSITSNVLSCSFGDMANGSSKTVTLSATTSAGDCPGFENSVTVSSSNDSNSDNNSAGPVPITVECPGLNVAKSAVKSPIFGGDVASFTIVVWNHGVGSALNATLNDQLPAGESGSLDWSIDPAYSGPGTCDISGSPGAQTLSCSFGNLAGGSSIKEPAASITLVATTSRKDCGTIENQASVAASNNDKVDSKIATIVVKCPTLVIEKSADTEEVHFKFDVDGKLLSTTPAVVTWTLTYTLTDGPVDNAVISDPLPAFLNYVDGSASDGGVYDAGSRTITWTFPTLSESGTVTFKTTTDPAAPEGKQIENVATIVSDQTVKDEGRDSILVTAEQVEAGTSSPSPSLPNSAIGLASNGQPPSIPIELMSVLLLLGLAGLGFANVRAVHRRQ